MAHKTGKEKIPFLKLSHSGHFFSTEKTTCWVVMVFVNVNVDGKLMEDVV